MSDLVKMSVDGDLPMRLSIQDGNLPPGIRPCDIASVLEEDRPANIVGQRTAIYELGDVFLKAKGFVYRPTDFAEVLQHEIGSGRLLDLERASSLDLAMANPTRPFRHRWHGIQGDFDRWVPQKDGRAARIRTEARPHGAMTLKRAMHEFETHVLLRSNRVRVDIPVGYAEFPDFAFGVADTDIPCGGFLSLIPNKYDLRLPEIAFHIQDPIVRETYGISDSAERFLIAAGTDAAGMLRFYHRMGVTHTFPHWMNFKVGVLDEDFKAWYALQDGHDTPATTICDLDACCYPNQDNHIFLANAMHLLQSGVDLSVIALWLGHEHIAATHQYMQADIEMKRKALRKMAEPKAGVVRFKPSRDVLSFLDSL